MPVLNDTVQIVLSATGGINGNWVIAAAIMPGTLAVQFDIELLRIPTPSPAPRRTPPSVF